MKRKVTAGTTEFSLPIKVFSTASTTGGGLTGLTNATSGLVAEYRRQGQATWTNISLVGAPTKTIGTWVDGGFLADGTRGAYELDLPNLALAAGARFVLVRLYGAANMLDVDVEIELDVVNYQTAAFGAALATHWTSTRAGYLDGVLLADNFSHRVVLVNGAKHAAVDVHAFQPDVIDSVAIANDAITAAKIAPNAIDADSLAADAVAEFQSGLSTLTAAQVNAEVLDVLQTDLFGELAAVPGASSSLKDKIAFLFMLARNKVTQTSSTQTLFADNTTTAVAAATTSDVGGTFTRGEFA